jgi:hypothetical protein
VAEEEAEEELHSERKRKRKRKETKNYSLSLPFYVSLPTFPFLPSLSPAALCLLSRAARLYL